MKTAYELLKDSGRINRDVIACEIGGEILDLTREVDENNCIKPLTFEDKNGKTVFWHTSSHVLAHAVKRLYPDAKLTIGPSIENGFYYDIDSEISFTPEILQKIEEEMQKIIKEDLKEERFVLTRDEAIKLMEERGEPYKVLLISRIETDENISFYKHLFKHITVCAFEFLLIAFKHSLSPIFKFAYTRRTKFNGFNQYFAEFIICVFQSFFA